MKYVILTTVMSPETPYKRTQLLVDRDYQLRFVTRLFMAVLAVAAVSSLIATGLLSASMYQPDLPQQTVVYCFVAVALTLLVELLISIPVIWVLGIRQSHRVVGPMNRLKKMIEAIGQGDFSQRITLREGDALEDLAKTLNTMAQSLQQRNAR